MSQVSEERWRSLLSSGGPSQGIKGLDLASAATVAVTHGLHVVSGVAAISLITLPFEGFAGAVFLRPTGIWTLATGGVATATNKPVGLAATSVVGRIMVVVYDPASGLWYPSYVS